MNNNYRFYIIGITIILTFAVCTIAAMYTPPNFGHSVTMITNKGGISKHPVLLGLNEDKYVIFASGTVKAPFKGSVKVVLEGEPKIEYEIFSRYPPELNLGIHKFHEFENNTIKNIYPWEKYALIVYVKPKNKIYETASYNLRFYDLKSNNIVLSIPIIFTELDNFDISKATRRPFSKAWESKITDNNPRKKDTISINKSLPSSSCCEE
ncbi:MAG: hypothetical protein WCL21_03520 [Mariniphaga sp.]